jgi:hypothetical protein
MVNNHVSERGYGYSELEFVIGPHDFEQILDTVKNRLLDFVLKVDENWHLDDEQPPRDALRNLVSVVILNEARGGNVTTFDQRGQQVNYQYNAAGNVNIGIVQDKDSLIEQVEKLKDEVEQAKQHGALSEDAAVEAKCHLLQATKEARQENPDKGSFLENIAKAKDSLQGVAALANIISALVKIAEVAGKVLV